MTETRAAAVAGLFYPGSAHDLQPAVEDCLQMATTTRVRSPKALIAPHAGYVYSGPIAASAFQCFIDERELIERIILLGPAHHLPVRGLALPGCDRFETPLGTVPVDAELVTQVEGLPQITVDRAAHSPEHCLEVELPFLQILLGEFSILPLLLTDATQEETAQVLDRVWGGPETRIVVSSDLSHYLAYERAQETDRQTCHQILELRRQIETFQACGAVAINGLLEAACRRGLEPSLLDLRNSGDTAGDRGRVVGYAAFAFAESA